MLNTIDMASLPVLQSSGLSAISVKSAIRPNKHTDGIQPLVCVIGVANTDRVRLPAVIAHHFFKVPVFRIFPGACSGCHGGECTHTCGACILA